MARIDVLVCHKIIIFGQFLGPFWDHFGTILPHLGLQKGSSKNVSKIDPPKSCKYHARATSKSPGSPLRCHNMTQYDMTMTHNVT